MKSPRISEIILPDLDVMLAEAERSCWTAEIDATLQKYYTQAARLRRVDLLVAAINKRFDRQYTGRQINTRAQRLGLQNRNNA